MANKLENKIILLINNEGINDLEFQQSPALIYNNVTLVDSTVYDPIKNICTATRYGMNITINPCKAESPTGTNIQHTVDFEWNGANQKNITWYFVYEGRLESGNMKLLENVSHYETQLVNTWVANHIVNDVVRYSNLGTPNTLCEIGNQNNTQMFNVTRQNNVNSTEYSTIYCFTSSSPINSTSFSISGNANLPRQVQVWNMEWVQLQEEIEYVGYNLLENNYSYYKAQKVSFEPGKKYKTKWTYTPINKSKAGKWHIFGFESETGLMTSVMTDTYIYVDPWWNSTYEYCFDVTLENNIATDRNNTVADIVIDVSSFSDKPYNNSIKVSNESCENGGYEVPSGVYNINQSDGLMSTFNLVLSNFNISGNQNKTFGVYYSGSSIDAPMDYNLTWDNQATVFKVNAPTYSLDLGKSGYQTDWNGIHNSSVWFNGQWRKTSDQDTGEFYKMQEVYDSVMDNAEVLTVYDSSLQNVKVNRYSSGKYNITYNFYSNGYVDVNVETLSTGIYSFSHYYNNYGGKTRLYSGTLYQNDTLGNYEGDGYGLPCSTETNGCGYSIALFKKTNLSTEGMLRTNTDSGYWVTDNSQLHSIANNHTLVYKPLNPFSTIEWTNILADIQQNATFGVTIGTETVFGRLKINLNAPMNGFYSNSSNVTFNCSAVDNIGVSNLTLVLDEINNYTIVGGLGQNLSIYESRILNEGLHNWTCIASNYTGAGFNTSTYYLTVDSLAPVVNITYPSDGFIITEFNQAFDLNWSITEENPNTCWYYGNVTNDPPLTYVDCSLNTTQINYPLAKPDNLTLMFYANDSGGLEGYSSVFIKRSFAIPNITVLYPENGFIITEPEELVNIFVNITSNKTGSCWYNTSSSSTNVFSNCSLGYFQLNYPSSKPDNLTVYMYVNDTLGNLGSTSLFLVKNNIKPNITIFEPFTTYDSIDIGEALGLNVSTTTNGTLDACWYTYPNPWNAGAETTTPINSSIYDNNISTFKGLFSNQTFYFNNSISNLTYEGGNCTTGGSCNNLYNRTIVTDSCNYDDRYTISARNIATFGCTRKLEIMCGDTMLFTETSQCLTEPYNMTVDLFPSSSIQTYAPNNAIEYTCNDYTTFDYLLGYDTVFVYANDTLGNFANQNRSWVSLFNIANETYDQEVLVSQTNDFRLDVITTASSILNPKLVYEGEVIDATLTTVSGTEFYLTASVITYQNLTGENEFYWNVTLDGSEYSSTAKTQNVSDINFSICGGDINQTYFRVNFIDETTSSPLASVIRTSSFEYWIDDQEASVIYDYGVTTNSTEYEFCFLPGYESVNVDASISYYASGYPERTAGISGILTNVTTNTTLSLLGVDDGIYATFTFIDSITKVGLDAVSVEISESGNLVIATTTDSSGSISEWLNPNILYQVAYSKSGYASGLQNRRPISTEPLIIEMDSEAFQIYPEITNGLNTIVYPTIRKLNNDTDYSFGFYASEGEVEIANMNYTVYDEDNNQIIATVARTGEGNMTQTIINTGKNGTLTLIAYVTGTNGKIVTRTAVFEIENFVSYKYSLDQWGLTFNEYFPVAQRTTLTKSIWFILWFIVMLGAFAFGYNGSFKSKEDYANNVSATTRGNTSTGMIFAFLVTLIFSYFNLIPAPFIPGNGTNIFTNGLLQQNFFASLMLIILVWDLFGSSITKYFRGGN